MKKLMLAVFAVAVTTQAAMAASSSATQTVDATVTETISLTIDSPTEALSLVPGTTSTATATLTVNSTNPYVITAAADSSAVKTLTHDAKLFEFNGSTYVTSGRKVDSALKVHGTAGTASGTPTTATDISTSGVTIFTGAGATADGTVTSTLTQATPQGTAKLPAGSTYHMVVTYTATTSTI